VRQTYQTVAGNGDIYSLCPTARQSARLFSGKTFFSGFVQESHASLRAGLPIVS
jgi:hypothetical protein